MDTMDELPALDTSSDVLLVQRTVAGDKRAYGLLVLKYQRRIQRLATKELAALVNTALSALPTDLRQALVLREIEGLSYEGIASAMDCRIGTVRSRIFRAREGISQAIPWLDNQSRKRW